MTEIGARSGRMDRGDRPGRRGARLRWAAVTTAVVALGACSSGSHSTASTSVPPPTSGPATTVAPTTASLPATTTAAAAAPCQAGQLQIVVSGSSGAAGTHELTFAITALSGPCTMRGYPGLRLTGAGGSPVATSVVQGGGLTFENLPVTTVTLNANDKALFNVGFNVVGPDPCVSATGVEVTPAGAVSPSPSIPSAIVVCGNGTLNVSPVFAATDATATQTTAV